MARNCLKGLLPEVQAIEVQAIEVQAIESRYSEQGKRKIPQTQLAQRKRQHFARVLTFGPRGSVCGLKSLVFRREERSPFWTSGLLGFRAFGVLFAGFCLAISC